MMKEVEEMTVTSWKIPRSTKRAVTFVTAALGYDSEHVALGPIAELGKRSMVHMELCCQGKYNRELWGLLPELVAQIFKPLCDRGLSPEEIQVFLEGGRLAEYVSQAVSQGKRA